MARKKYREKRQRSAWALGAIAAGAVIVLIAILLLLSQVTDDPEAGPDLPQANIPYPQVERVTLEDAKAAYDENLAVFLDVRSTSSYDSGHIPGAVPMPLNEVESRFDELDPSDWIITYCT